MTRKLDAAQEGAARVLSLRLPPALADALDVEARRRAAAAGVPVTAAAVARVLLERALLGATTTRATTAQEAAQGTTTSSTPARPTRARKAAAAPPTASPKADDEADDERQLPLLDEGTANDHDRRNAAQAAMLLDEGADDRHARRSAEHTAAAALQREIAALNMSARGIAAAMTAAGFPLSGRAVSQFVSGATAGLPRWADKFRAWRAQEAGV